MSRTGHPCLAATTGLAIAVNIFLLFFFGGPRLPEWIILACWIWVIFGLIVITWVYNTPPSKPIANSPQASYQIPTVELSSSTTPNQRKQSGDPVASTSSNAHNDDRKQILHKARRGVIYRALAVGIIPAAVLFGLYGYFYPYIQCSEAKSDNRSSTCSIIAVKLFVGIANVVWLLVYVYVRLSLEWRRWKKWYLHDGEIELGHVQTVESNEQNIQK